MNFATIATTSIYGPTYRHEILSTHLKKATAALAADHYNEGLADYRFGDGEYAHSAAVRKILLVQDELDWDLFPYRLSRAAEEAESNGLAPEEALTEACAVTQIDIVFDEKSAQFLILEQSDNK